LVLSPDGRYLYATVRNAGEIVGFEVGQGPELRQIGSWKCKGLMPWDARISPSGRHLLVANEDTGNVEVFLRDIAAGELHSTGISIDCPKPTCVMFHEN
jgi:6-phosphogluconolactonase